MSARNGCLIYMAQNDSLSFSNTEEYGGAKITAFLPMHLPEPFASHTMTEFKEEAHEFITCR